MHNDALHLNNYDLSTLNILLVVHIIIHYKTCHQEVEICKREHYVGTFMIYSGTRPCILHLSIPMLINVYPLLPLTVLGVIFSSFYFHPIDYSLNGHI